MQSDWGPFQDQHLFSQEQSSQSLLKPFGLQQCLWWQVKIFDVAIWCVVWDVHCTTRELHVPSYTTELASQSDKQLFWWTTLSILNYRQYDKQLPSQSLECCVMSVRQTVTETVSKWLNCQGGWTQFLSDRNALSLFTGHVNILIIRRYAPNKLLKKEV